MATDEKLTLGNKLMIGFLILSMLALLNQCFNSKEGKNSDLNLENTSELQNYVQGKWHLAYYPSGSLTVHVRLLIEGNTIKTWGNPHDKNYDNPPQWDMNQPPSNVYTFTIGEKTNDGKRYLEWDANGDLTMEQRAIGEMYLAKSGFHYGASYWVVERGWE